MTGNADADLYPDHLTVKTCSEQCVVVGSNHIPVIVESLPEKPQAGRLTIQAGIASDQNPKHRANQQDAAGAGELTLFRPSGGYLHIRVIGVFDGVGGSNGGGLASSTASQSVVTGLLSAIADVTDKDQLREIVEAAFSTANRIIRAAPHPYANSATTGAACVVIDDEWLGRWCGVVHLGDSRVYAVPRGGIGTLLTRDHSYVQTLVDAGEITPEEALAHPDSNIITAALGAAPTSPAVRTTINELNDSIAIIALTDGVWGALERSLKDDFPTYLADIVWRLSPQDAAETLVAAAIGAGSDDNATAAIMRIDVAEPLPVDHRS